MSCWLFDRSFSVAKQPTVPESERDHAEQAYFPTGGVHYHVVTGVHLAEHCAGGCGWGVVRLPPCDLAVVLT